MNLSNTLQIETRQELCEWLSVNSNIATHAWIPVLSKNHDELSYLAVVEESICITSSGMSVLPDMNIENFKLRQDIFDAVSADEEIYANFLKLPPLYVRVRIDNIQSYPLGDETYERRLTKFLENTKKGVLFGDRDDNGRLSEEAQDE
jgi:hypothetical protein